jgi:monoamine oxidase
MVRRSREGGNAVARTPLFRALQRLAEEHTTANELGMPPAELRGLRSEAAYTRREALKRAGIAGAAVAIGAPLAAASANAATAPRIAIVGGGIAGLTAAMTLADAGFASTVYEASTTRVGGRMHSDSAAVTPSDNYWDNGQVSEFCGELIDSDHKTIRHLAKRFGLPTDDLLAAEPNNSTQTFYFFGAYYPEKQADKDFPPVHQAVKSDFQTTSYPTLYNSYTPGGLTLDHMSVYDWIETRVPGGHTSPMGQLLEVAYNEEYGAETTDQSALNILYLLEYQPKPGNFSIFGTSDERFHIVGGNQQLPEAIANYIGRQNIKMGYAMQAIAANADGTVSINFSTPGAAQTIVADQVILCMSFSVLRTLDFSKAGFDSLKQTAITQLGSGRNAKLQLQFTSRYWNTRGPWGLSTGDVYTDLGFQNTWDVTRAQPGATGIIVAYTGGNDAGAFAPPTPYSNAATDPQVTSYASAFLSKLETVYPGITPLWNGKATLSTPFLDPLLNCSYSYWRVGQYTGFSGYEGVVQGSIHFAGEHCSIDFQGFMEGGAAEGVRAAGEIVALFKKK